MRLFPTALLVSSCGYLPACSASPPDLRTQGDLLEASMTAALLSCVELSATRPEAEVCQERVRVLYAPLWDAYEQGRAR